MLRNVKVLVRKDRATADERAYERQREDFTDKGLSNNLRPTFHDLVCDEIVKDCDVERNFNLLLDLSRW
jgi:hypothetical protein